MTDQERLAAYEAFAAEVREELSGTVARMEDLQAQNKVKTATSGSSLPRASRSRRSTAGWRLTACKTDGGLGAAWQAGGAAWRAGRGASAALRVESRSGRLALA